MNTEKTSSTLKQIKAVLKVDKNFQLINRKASTNSLTSSLATQQNFNGNSVDFPRLKSNITTRSGTNSYFIHAYNEEMIVINKFNCE